MPILHHAGSLIRRIPWIGLGCIAFGVTSGFLVGTNPLLLAIPIIAVVGLIYFFTCFEQAVMGLLIVRSSLDPFSSLQLPAVYAITVDALTILYLIVAVLQGRSIKCDRFWWFFAAWVVLQGLWVILLPFGGLGLDGSVLADSVREWVRLFSWLMVYLLVMQLKDRIHPEKIISQLLLATVAPLVVGTLQMVLPGVLPSYFLPIPGNGFDTGSRINGTLGHPNTFATFILLFIAIVCWQLIKSTRPWRWLIMLSLLAFFYVGSKALFSLMMLAVFVTVLIVPRLSLVNLIGGIVLFALVIGLFASTPFGQERLSSVANTPLINPHLPVDRAILLSQTDNNSFNWRLSQWTYLLKQCEQFPLLGYGLGVSMKISTNGLLPHNDYVRALVEGGIVGFTTYITFFIAQVTRLLLLFKNSSHPLQRNLCISLLGIILAITVGMITENIWSHTTMFFYWWTFLAIAGWDWNHYSAHENIPIFTSNEE
jgi:O-Antigen ligase